MREKTKGYNFKIDWIAGRTNLIIVQTKVNKLISGLLSVRFEPAIRTVAFSAPVCVSVQSGPMLRLITWAFGLALIKGQSSGQGGGGLGPQRGLLSAVPAADGGTLWVAGSLLTPNQLCLVKQAKRNYKPKNNSNLKVINFKVIRRMGGRTYDPG